MLSLTTAYIVGYTDGGTVADNDQTSRLQGTFIDTYLTLYFVQ